MNTSDEWGHTQGNTTGPVLGAVDEALHEALSDVRRARALVEGRYARGDDQVEAVRRLLQAVEDNLLNTVVGIRLVSRHREAASTSDAPHLTQDHRPVDRCEVSSDAQQGDL
jgi:hypothetical protein